MLGGLVCGLDVAKSPFWLAQITRELKTNLLDLRCMKKYGWHGQMVNDVINIYHVEYVIGPLLAAFEFLG